MSTSCKVFNLKGSFTNYCQVKLQDIIGVLKNSFYNTNFVGFVEQMMSCIAAGGLFIYSFVTLTAEMLSHQNRASWQIIYLVAMCHSFVWLYLWNAPAAQMDVLRYSWPPSVLQRLKPFAIQCIGAPSLDNLPRRRHRNLTN